MIKNKNLSDLLVKKKTETLSGKIKKAQEKGINIIFLEDFNNIDDLLEYFDEFNLNLSKKTLNYYLKSVINP